MGPPSASRTPEEEVPKEVPQEVLQEVLREGQPPTEVMAPTEAQSLLEAQPPPEVCLAEVEARPLHMQLLPLPKPLHRLLENQRCLGVKVVDGRTKCVPSSGESSLLQ